MHIHVAYKYLARDLGSLPRWFIPNTYLLWIELDLVQTVIYITKSMKMQFWGDNFLLVALMHPHPY